MTHGRINIPFVEGKALKGVSKHMKHPKIYCLVICLLIFVLLSQASANEVTYKDVPKTHWAYEAIEALSKAGIVKGFPDKTFKPNLNVTREQFAVVLVLTLKLPTDNKAPQIFSDIKPGHRSFLYIDATKSFIPTSSNPQGSFNFNADKVITREEVAEAIVLALGLNNKQKADVRLLSNMFKDYKTISPLFRENVTLAVYNRIMSGNSNGTFNGKGALTRAELSVILNKLLQNIRAEQALTQQTPTQQNVYKPQHKPWTIEFIDFPRPDYNQIQSFYGAVASKVYDPNNFYLVMKHTTINNNGNYVSSTIKTVNVYVYEKDLNLFSVGDTVIFDYNRNNNITSYNFQNKVDPRR